MASVLKEDTFQRRRHDSEPAAATVRTGRGALTVALMLVCVGLLALSRLDHSLVKAARGMLEEAGAPVLGAAIVPFRPLQAGIRTASGMFEAHLEAERLRADNQRLRGWEARAKEIERRLLQLEQLAKVVPAQPLNFATARVIADSGSIYGRSALLDGGREVGFKNGFPVINADGLVGRISWSGARSARLMLVTDLNSRIPVSIGQASVRAVLHGDNGGYPKLAHVPGDARIEPGDEVITSGVGGVFPRGLKIGTVVEAGDHLRVELGARLDRLEYVSVLFFEGANVFADEEPVAPRQARRRARADDAGETH